MGLISHQRANKFVNARHFVAGQPKAWLRHRLPVTNGVRLNEECEGKMTDGQRFSQVYIERGEPSRDSIRFRNRLAAFFGEKLSRNHKGVIAASLCREAGIEIPVRAAIGYDMTGMFKNSELRDVLDSITIIHQTLTSEGAFRLAEEWQGFVSRSLQEENVGYRLDARCGVHYFVDEEFERSRASTLAALNEPELNGVRAAFDDAFRFLDNTPPDTKASTRSIFEACEILVKQLVDTRNMNRWVIENPIKEMAINAIAQDETEERVISGMFDGYADWVNAVHNYRHGQPDHEPVAPSEELTVYILSTGCAFLRLLLELRGRI